MSNSQPAEDIRRVLVPTDFSANADAALRWAIEIGKARGATITLLHVADVVAMTSLPMPIQEQIAEGLAVLEGTVRESGVEVASIQRAGRPWERIAAEADEVDLVVIGARGQTPRAIHVLGIGSTADRVLRASPVPVLTVHTDDASNVRLPRKIIVPTDFSETAGCVMSTLARMFAPIDGADLEITLLHAWQPMVDYGYAFGAAGVVNPLDGTEEEARRTLESTAERLKADGLAITPVIRVGYPAGVIEEEARETGADLVAIGTHGRAGLNRWMFGSVAERVVHHAPCPVLTVCRVAAAEEQQPSGRVEAAC